MAGIETMLREVQIQRDDEARLWLDGVVQRGGTLPQLEKIFEKLLVSRNKAGKYEMPLYDLKVDCLATKLDQMINPTGKRMPTREEESTVSFSQFISALELGDRMSERIK